MCGPRCIVNMPFANQVYGGRVCCGKSNASTFGGRRPSVALLEARHLVNEKAEAPLSTLGLNTKLVRSVNRRAGMVNVNHSRRRLSSYARGSAPRFFYLDVNIATGRRACLS